MQQKQSIGVMTSGGDAQGMNAAVRAVVRTGLSLGIDVYAIFEGYQGMVDGGDSIRKAEWSVVSGILEQGGTVIGTARCQEFRDFSGRLKAALNLLEHGIDKLVVIGGDGSLTGANCFSEEWPKLLKELLKTGKITKETAKAHPTLTIVGLVGSIDNDMANTDMTIGADTALRQIVDAVDSIGSTAASHQRTFVVEVMGRNCGYLALMSAIATGASWVLIPEHPPKPGWEKKMCGFLDAGRKAGRRDSIIIVAEGARDRKGNPITVQYVKDSIEKHLGVEARITILGHVQRGGSPTAFDRYMSTLLGYHAVKEALETGADKESKLIGMKENRVKVFPLMKSVEITHEVPKAIESDDYDKAVRLRGSSFGKMRNIFRTLCQSVPDPAKKNHQSFRLGVMNASWPSPGMNKGIRTAVRLGMNMGHTMLGISNGFEGLIKGNIKEMGWMEVEDWYDKGGSILGTNRKIPEDSDLYAIAKNIEENSIKGILVIGGWTGYKGVQMLQAQRKNFPAFNIPFICVPASINNNLPAAELSVGCDTALNIIVDAIDKIKHSVDTTRRAFIVEVMGRYCGYLAQMSGLATGAELTYLHEEGITVSKLMEDLKMLTAAFKKDRHTALIIRNEMANSTYTSDFIRRLFDEEGGDLFDVKMSILGAIQQGGIPTSFDRTQATWLAAEGIERLVKDVKNSKTSSSFIGLQGGKITFHDFEKMDKMVIDEHYRPKKQWWLELRDIVNTLAKPDQA